MDKFRAKVKYTMALRRARAGSIETVYDKNAFDLICSILKENNWEEEAWEYFKEDSLQRLEILKPIEEEYYNYLVSGKKDENLDKYYEYALCSYSVDGVRVEVVKYKAAHDGKEPTRQDIEEAMKIREKEDKDNMTCFVNSIVHTFFGEDYDKGAFLKAKDSLENRGLLNMAIYHIKFAWSAERGKRLKSLGDDYPYYDRDVIWCLYPYPTWNTY